MTKETLVSFRKKIEEMDFNKNLSGVQGWLKPAEKKALYALSIHSSGPILEIGSWVGLSSACIAYGIKDSDTSKSFVTTDLDPAIEYFRPVENNQMGLFLPGETTARVCITTQTFKQDIEPVISKPDRAIGQLKHNLSRLGLINLVTIIRGDFTNAPDKGYKFIFCDATHNSYEISIPMPALKPFLAPGVILACHDIDQTNETYLKQYVSFRDSLQVETLFIGEVA